MYNKKTYNKFYSYFIDKIGVRDYRRGWLKGDCPACGKNDKFGINLYMNKTNCFVCGYNPTPKQLVAELEELENDKDVLSIINGYEEREYLAPVLKQIEDVEFTLPEGYTNILLGNSKLAQLARNYVTKRGFDINEVALKGWGYCTKGNLFGYLIMPFYMGGKLVYYNARIFIGNGPKYNNPSMDDGFLGKSLILYNADALDIYKEVYLLEGLINAETIGEQGIATGGKKVSEQQISMIIKSPVESVVLLLDPDAIQESVKLAMDLVFYKKVKLVYWKEDKDVNDIGKDKTLEIIKNTKYINYKELIRFRNELKQDSILTY